MECKQNYKTCFSLILASEAESESTSHIFGGLKKELYSLNYFGVTTCRPICCPLGEIYSQNKTQTGTFSFEHHSTCIPWEGMPNVCVAKGPCYYDMVHSCLCNNQLTCHRK